MNDSFSMFFSIPKCSKYSRKCSASKLDIGDHIANSFGCL